MPKTTEKPSKGGKEPPSTPPEDLSSSSGNALEFMRKNATETPSFAGLAADANSKPGHVSSKRSLESPTRSSKPAKAAAGISKPAKVAVGPSKPEKAETASRSAKAAASSSKPAKAASKPTTPVPTGSTEPTVASPEPQLSTSWADQAEHEDQDATVGKAGNQHTPST